MTSTSDVQELTETKLAESELAFKNAPFNDVKQHQERRDSREIVKKKS